MADKQKSPQIDFAKRHIETEVSTFDAYSALVRMDVLIHDARDLQENLELVPESMRARPWGYSIVNYYLVGFVTCLEWHARARLYDLYVFAPQSIDQAELKQSVNAANIAQLLSEKLTVSHFLAASTNVSSPDRYVSIFDRIFKQIGSPAKMSAIMNERIIEGVTFGSSLAYLFKERNTLVHEISNVDIGHMNIRNILSLEDVISIGENVELLMKKIEAEITRGAPSHFPGLLDDGQPRDEIARLEEAIALTEAFIAQRIDEGECPQGVTEESWQTSCDAFETLLSEELDRIRLIHMPGQKYWDNRPSIMKTLLKQRLTYLDAYRKLFIFDPEEGPA